jgi:hypothetical protein
MNDTFLQYATYVAVAAAVGVLSSLCVTMMVLLWRAMKEKR